MEIGEGIEEFSVYMRLSRYSARTQKQYLWYLRKLNIYLEEKKIFTLEAITRSIIRHWSADMADKWGPATHRQAICAIKGLFKFLVEDEVLAADPAKSLCLPNVPKRTYRTLTSEEMNRLLETIEMFDSPRGEREIALVCLLADSGLRAREVCQLKISDLDLKSGLLWVIGKGDKQDVAPFGEITTQHLENWLKVRKHWLLQNDLPDVDTVFISIGGLTRGQSLTPDGLRRLFAYLGKDAEIEGLSPHVFRRTFATLLLENGAPSRITQIAGRWSNLNMVERYTRALEETKKLPSLYRPYSPIDHLPE